MAAPPKPCRVGRAARWGASRPHIWVQQRFPLQGGGGAGTAVCTHLLERARAGPGASVCVSVCTRARARWLVVAARLPDPVPGVGAREVDECPPAFSHLTAGT